MSPQDLAARRAAAIAALQEQLGGHVPELERELLQGMLSRLQDIQADPAILSQLLDEFTDNVHLPVLQWMGQSLLQLPALTLNYYQALDAATDYAALKAPLDAYIRTVFGLGPDGEPLPGGLLYTFAGDQTVKRELLQYGYRAMLSGAGLSEMRAGLTQLVTGGADSGGLYTRLHARSYDFYNQADRVLQGQVAESLGWEAYIYQGGLIAGSRAFCKTRAGKVWLRSEIDGWKSLSFDGKPDPYTPFVQLGGYNCRHSLSGIPNLVAMQLRPELREDARGRLIVGNAD